MSDYFVTRDLNISTLAIEFSGVYHKRSLPIRHGTHPTTGKGWTVKVSNVDPSLYPSFGTYPLILSGEGSPPALADLSEDNWDEGTETASADRIPYVVSKVESASDFMDRFTDDERLLLQGSTDPKIILFLAKMQDAGRTVDRALTKYIAAVNYAETQGHIAAGRAAEILA